MTSLTRYTCCVAALCLCAFGCGREATSEGGETLDETASEAVTSPDGGTCVDWDNGHTPCPDNYVCDQAKRCVKPSYTIDADAGTVQDDNTGLVWQRETDHTGYSWEKAKTYCGQLSLGGFSDWKLPGASQLVTLMDARTSGVNIDSAAFPASSSVYWTSTCDALECGGTCSATAGCAYEGYFSHTVGAYMGFDGTTGHLPVRCVR